MSFTYNGINCESLGMFVEKFPNRPFPTKKVTTYNILGRNGDLIVEHGGYNNVIQEYDVYVNGSGSGLQANLTAIARWLLYDPVGYEKLTDTYDPSIYREARVVGGEEFINALNRFGKATLQFDCKPQRLSVVPDEAVISGTTTASYTVPSDPARMPGKPFIDIRNVEGMTLVEIELNGVRVFKATTIPGYPQDITVDFENQTFSGDFQTGLLGPSTNWENTTVNTGDIITITVGNSIDAYSVDATIYLRRWQL